jgi:hypothetical protein
VKGSGGDLMRVAFSYFRGRAESKALIPENSLYLARDFNTCPPVFKVGPLRTQLDYPLGCVRLFPGHLIEVLNGFVGSELKCHNQY